MGGSGTGSGTGQARTVAVSQKRREAERKRCVTHLALVDLGAVGHGEDRQLAVASRLLAGRPILSSDPHILEGDPCKGKGQADFLARAFDVEVCRQKASEAKRTRRNDRGRGRRGEEQTSLEQALQSLTNRADSVQCSAYYETRGPEITGKKSGQRGVHSRRKEGEDAIAGILRCSPEEYPLDSCP